MITNRKMVMGVLVGAVVLAAGVAVAAPPAHQTATQFYMAYRAAFDKATKIEDITPYMCAANRKQAEDTPKAERDQMFEMIKSFDTHTKIKVTKEDHRGDGSVALTVTAYDTDQQKEVGATVTIVKEDGAWKLQKESWTSGS